jgi:uncharacterized protein (DUF2147 family)
MKRLIFSILFLFSMISSAQSHSVIGKWKTIDDETGKPISIVEVYEKNHKIYGKVIEILNPANRNRVCEKCKGDDRNKPIIGLTIIKGLTKVDDEYTNGKILDPKNGKLYSCYITLENQDKLKVRGYIGISLFGRTQYWIRMK